MISNDRPSPIDAATAFVTAHFPDFLCAFAGGSPFRGDATPTSDLDIVVFTTHDDAPFRASYREHGWPIEVFVHTEESFPRYVAADGNRPVLPTMILEGIVVRDTAGIAERLRADARELLSRGPAALTQTEIEDRRYALTDLIDDLTGCTSLAEGMFVATALAHEASGLILLLNRQWIGHGKWVLRALRRHDEALADGLTAALTTYAREGDSASLLAFAHRALDLAGGPLFEGYYRRGT